jgi:hypothetical protein
MHVCHLLIHVLTRAVYDFLFRGSVRPFPAVCYRLYVAQQVSRRIFNNHLSTTYVSGTPEPNLVLNSLLMATYVHAA